jgi:hypothetical protein
MFYAKGAAVRLLSSSDGMMLFVEVKKMNEGPDMCLRLTLFNCYCQFGQKAGMKILKSNLGSRAGIACCWLNSSSCNAIGWPAACGPGRRCGCIWNNEIKVECLHVFDIN